MLYQVGLKNECSALTGSPAVAATTTGTTTTTTTTTTAISTTAAATAAAAATATAAVAATATATASAAATSLTTARAVVIVNTPYHKNVEHIVQSKTTVKLVKKTIVSHNSCIQVQLDCQCKDDLR